MPDPTPNWRTYVRERLPPLAVSPEREAELVEQLAGQLQDRYVDALQSGATPAEAFAAAEADVPSWTNLARDLIRDEPHTQRTMNRIEAAGDFGRDAVYLLRSMRKAPLLYGAIVLILAATVGLTAIVFSAVYGVLLKPFPFANYDRVVLLTEQRPDGKPFPISAPNYVDWRERNDAFETLAAFVSSQLTLGAEDYPERLQAARVSAGFFDLLGLQTTLGRGFVAGEDQPEAPAIAVLSDSLWTRRFDRDPAAVGRTIQLDNVPYTVIGILPRSFEFPAARRVFGGTPVDVLVPLKLAPPMLGQRGLHYLTALALRKSGVSEPQARASMIALAARMSGEFPQNEGWSAQVSGLDEAIFGKNRRILTLLSAAIGFVVLIGCANIANLLLARGAVRAREFAVRLSLGCSRSRLLRQMLSESLLVALLGGALGLALAYQGLDALVRIAPQDLPRIESVEMNGLVLWFSIAMCTLTALVFGIGPAWQASRIQAAAALHTGRPTPGSGAQRLERPLIAIEVALTAVLLIGAGLLVQSLRRLQDVETGYRPAGVATFRVQPSAAQYPNAAAQLRYFEAVRDRVAAIPGVETVSSTWSLPLSDPQRLVYQILSPSRGHVPSGQGSAVWYPVMPGYFEAMGIPLLRGRDFNQHDTLDAPHRTIVNQTFARNNFGDEDPLGKKLLSSGDEVEIVGVVGDTIHADLESAPEEQYYVPVGGTPFSVPGGRIFLARSALQPEALFPAISRAVLEVDPELPASNLSTLQQALRDATATQRTAASLLSLFAALALALAAAGVYAVIAYFVVRRMPEFGVRAALGAGSATLFRSVLARGLLMALPGLILGLAASAAATRYLETLLFDVHPRDLTTFALTAGTILLASLIACALPALRAARANPMAALREE